MGSKYQLITGRTKIKMAILKKIAKVIFGARDWIRTSTSLRTLPPEDSASTNFATRAGAVEKVKTFKRFNG